MTTIPVSHWSKKVKSLVSVDDPVWKAWRAMKNDGVSVLPVASSDKIIGLVTAKDIVRASDHNGGQSMSVREAMSLDPLIVNEDRPLVDVVQSMIRKDQQYAIVTSKSLGSVGVFSWSEAFLFFLEQNQIDFNITKGVVND